MTRKDYIALAKAINDADRYDGGEDDDIIGISVVLNIADALAADNPRFDRERFLKACGVQS